MIDDPVGVRCTSTEMAKPSLLDNPPRRYIVAGGFSVYLHNARIRESNLQELTNCGCGKAFASELLRDTVPDFDAPVDGEALESASSNYLIESIVYECVE